jgi:hypothetical protein
MFNVAVPDTGGASANKVPAADSYHGGILYLLAIRAVVHRPPPYHVGAKCGIFRLPSSLCYSG